MTGGPNSSPDTLVHFEGSFTREEQTQLRRVLQRAEQQVGGLPTYSEEAGPPWTVTRYSGNVVSMVAITRYGIQSRFAAHTIELVLRRVEAWINRQRPEQSDEAS